MYLYIHNKYTQYTHILCKQKLLLNAINHLTALVLSCFLFYVLCFALFCFVHRCTMTSETHEVVSELIVIKIIITSNVCSKYTLK